MPKDRSGRSICTAETSEPPDSPPTIQPVPPVTVAAACETGTWSWPAGSSCRVAGSNAQMVRTVRVTMDASAPVTPPRSPGGSWVEPTPGACGCAAGLSPPARNTSPRTVSAAAPASRSGRWPITVALCRAGSTSWMASTGLPACGPVTAWPPNT